MQLVAGTSRRDQSQGLVPSCVPTFKFSSMSPSGHLNMASFHSHPICTVTSIFSRNQSKNHSYDKLNRKQVPLWSCFAFIMRNIDQNTATKSLYAHKSAENSHSWKSSYKALQAQYWINVHHVCQYLTDSSCKNKYFWNWSNECCWHYINKWININDYCVCISLLVLCPWPKHVK